MEKSPERFEILRKIDELEKQGLFDKDVEVDPVGRELLPHEVDYLYKKFKSRVASRYAFYVARKFMNKALKSKRLIISEIKGIENIDNVEGGAILTSNHFAAFDSFAMQIVYETSKNHKKRKMWRVIKEGNYTSFPGFYGLLMRHCNTLPLSSNYKTMQLFLGAIKEALKRGDLILLYPEQSMWWNYRKPKPLKGGAFKFSYQNNVPIIPCFFTLEDSDIIGDDGFPIQKYTAHILKPIYPDLTKPLKVAAQEMADKNYELWKQVYEETYKIPLVYLNE